jgi:hypothetical protein
VADPLRPSRGFGERICRLGLAIHEEINAPLGELPLQQFASQDIVSLLAVIGRSSSSTNESPSYRSPSPSTDLEHGLAHPQYPALLRPVRTPVIGERVRDKIAASKCKGILGRRPGSPRLKEHGQEARGCARRGGARPKSLCQLSAARFDRRAGSITRQRRHQTKTSEKLQVHDQAPHRSPNGSTGHVAIGSKEPVFPR